MVGLVTESNPPEGWKYYDPYELFTVNETADKLKISRVTLYALIGNKQITPKKFNTGTPGPGGEKGKNHCQTTRPFVPRPGGPYIDCPLTKARDLLIQKNIIQKPNQAVR